MLTIYIYNCTLLHKNDHDYWIGIKCELQEQLQYKGFIKCIKIDVSAHIYFVAILIVT